MDALLEQYLIDQSESEMSPMQAYWIRVNTIAADIDPEAAAMDERALKVNPRHSMRFMKTSQKIVYVTSVKVPGKQIIPGRVFCMAPYGAAERIATGTHRLSAPEEIKAWHDEQNRRREVAAALKASQLPPVPQIPAPNVTVTLSAEAVREMRDSGKKQPANQPAS